MRPKSLSERDSLPSTPLEECDYNKECRRDSFPAGTNHLYTKESRRRIRRSTACNVWSAQLFFPLRNLSNDSGEVRDIARDGEAGQVAYRGLPRGGDEFEIER